MLPSQYPEAQPYPHLRRILKANVDMQFADLRTLLMLPRPDEGLDAGCNLTATILCMNIAAGVSVLMWDASPKALEARGERGKRFKSLVRTHYPWSSDDSVSPDYGTRLLYDYTRNPLSHTLGIGKTLRLFPGIPADEREVWLAKPQCGLEPRVVDDVLSSLDRPMWLDPTIVTGHDGHTISVVTLSWGVHRMLRSLFADGYQAAAADATARALFGE